ncbi:DUF3631 domain-containing protein [Mycobacterium sp.]|uniref:DUF3631 domain-containing protein n=1 Tax=Mycobacterium sp. TaxID=1785 RepID=UPI0031D881BF
MTTADDDYAEDLRNWFAEDDPNGAELLDDIKHFLSRFVAYPSEHELVAHTLWVAHCWFMQYWDSTPRIAFLSPEPGSGKSRALEVTEPLVPRPIHAINCTPAYLFRKVSDPAGTPTVLYDECDTLFGPKAKEHEEIRGVINAGHRKGAIAGRCVMRGKVIETEELPAYCAVALAGLDDLPQTIMSRSVIVRMRRRAPSERVEPWRPRVNGPEAAALYQHLAAWSASAEPLAEGWPTLPDSVADRDADVWEALAAVADLAGGDWPRVARATAATLATAARARQPSLGILLLGDIRTAFRRDGRDRMPTVDILCALNKMDESPWGTIRRGEPLDARGLASRLAKYGVGPRFQRSGGESAFRGYARAQFEDVWSRYLPADDDGGVGQPAGVSPDFAVASVATATEQVNGTGSATAATAATDATDNRQPNPSAEQVNGTDQPPPEQLFPDPTPPDDPDTPRCGCGNLLLTSAAVWTGMCRPCRDRSRA